MKILRRRSLYLIAMLCLPAAAWAKDDYFMYVGTYTRGTSKGIYGFRFNPGAGTATPLGLMAELTNPSFLTISPNRRFLYAVNEVNESGSVTAYAIDGKSGKLTMLNAVSSKGSGPCHLIVDKTNKSLLVANYNSGSVAALPLKPDGSLGEATSFIQHTGSSVNKDRQTGPHAHSVNLFRDNHLAIVSDLGLDKVLVYRFNPAKGTLAPNDPPFGSLPPGSGPRHFAFHPSGKFAYSINEIKSTVTTFSYDSRRGALKELQTISTLPEGFTASNSTAEIEVDSKGRFLYGSNRGHDSIAVFAIDQAKGTLTPIEQVPTGGKVPRNFALDPTGRYLLAANQNSNDIFVFRVDPRSGRLAATGQRLEVSMPVCIKFVAAK